MLRTLTVIPAIGMAGVRFLISLFFLAYLQILSSCENEGNKNITVVLSGRVWVQLAPYQCTGSGDPAYPTARGKERQRRLLSTSPRVALYTSYAVIQKLLEMNRSFFVGFSRF